MLHRRIFFLSQAHVCIVVVELDSCLLHLIPVALSVSVRREIVNLVSLVEILLLTKTENKKRGRDAFVVVVYLCFFP